jgi:hypothetical protein
MQQVLRSNHLVPSIEFWSEDRRPS